MRLFIAEKPSLAAAIASGLPGTPTKSRTHIKVGDNDVVTWCVGHILEQFMPEDYDPALKQWRAESLPIAPVQWKLKIKDGMQDQVKAIEDLLKKADIVVNAGDPDREGQLLVDEVLLYLGNRKPVQRVLVSDYNEVPLKKALASIQSNDAAQFRGWYESALARSRFDWLFGLNLTRAYTLAARRIGYAGVLSVGRVQTPTLGLVVARDLAIVPTSRRMDASALADNERKVYDMIVRTYLAQFFPPSQFLKTDIDIDIVGEKFTAMGKTPVSAGWREIYAQPEPEDESSDSGENEKQALPAMNQGDAAQCKQCVANNRKTTPPQRFTEKLLLAAMVDIHKYVDDPAAKARLKEGQGIGTEATRAGIIEELKKRGFIGPLKAGSKQIASTPAGRGLIAALPEHAKNPALTGICEQALDMVAAGRLSGDDFIARNMQLITKLVTDASTATLNVPVAPTFSCPKCKTGQLRKRNGKNGAFWSCSNWNAEPKCDATYDDFRGKPNFNPKPKGGGFGKKTAARKPMQK